MRALNLCFSLFSHTLVALIFVPIGAVSVRLPSARPHQTASPTGISYIFPYPSKTCPSPLSPFYTPRNTSHLSLPYPTSASLSPLLLLNGTTLPMLISGSESLKASSPPRAPPRSFVDTIVLFDGGDSCVWSKAIRRPFFRASSRIPALSIAAVDAHRFPALNPHLGVHAFPAIMAFRFGSVRAVYAGNRTEDSFVEWMVAVGGVQPEDSLVRSPSVDGASVDGLEVVDETAYSVADSAIEEWLQNAEKDFDETDWYLAAAAFVTLAAAVVGIRDIAVSEEKAAIEAASAAAASLAAAARAAPDVIGLDAQRDVSESGGEHALEGRDDLHSFGETPATVDPNGDSDEYERRRGVAPSDPGSGDEEIAEFSGEGSDGGSGAS